jgi:hypothetical protein
MDHLAREVTPDAGPADIVARDQQQLLEWIWKSERLKVLVDFTKKHLPSGSPLARALGAREQSIQLELIHPALAALNTGYTAPSFDLPCAVLVFEKSSRGV